MKLKPLPTFYDGRRFRSSLEARWAAYFDMIGAVWRHEPEAYAIPSGSYLPDFLIPSAGPWWVAQGYVESPHHPKGLFIEVKPTQSQAIAAARAMIELREATGVCGCVVWGDPSPLQFPLVLRESDITEPLWGCNFSYHAFTWKGWGEPFYSPYEPEHQNADYDNSGWIAAEMSIKFHRDRSGNLCNRFDDPLTRDSLIQDFKSRIFY